MARRSQPTKKRGPRRDRKGKGSRRPKRPEAKAKPPTPAAEEERRSGERRKEQRRKGDRRRADRRAEPSVAAPEQPPVRDAEPAERDPSLERVRETVSAWEAFRAEQDEVAEAGRRRGRLFRRRD
jgi:hypothetical protein